MVVVVACAAAGGGVRAGEGGVGMLRCCGIWREGVAAVCGKRCFGEVSTGGVRA